MALGASIMTNSSPLLQVTYKVGYSTSCSIRLQQMIDPQLVIEPGPLDRELSAITARPGQLLLTAWEQFEFKNVRNIFSNTMTSFFKGTFSSYQTR